jgi:hypothetical protein
VLAIPALIIVISLGVERVLSRLESLWPRILKFVTIFGFIYFIAWFSYNNLRDYFVVFNNDPHTQVYYRYIDKLDADYMLKNTNRKILISPYLSWNYYYGMMNELSAPKFGQFVQVDDPSLFQLFNIYDSSGRSATLIGEGIYHKLFPIYREYFPGAKIDVIWDPNFWQFDYKSNLKYCYEWRDPDKTIDLNYHYGWFYMYDNDVKFCRLARAEISSEDMKKVYTLKADFYSHGKKISEKDINFPLSAANSDFDTVEISGLIDIPEYSGYEFSTDGAVSRIYLDNKAATGMNMLYKGLHRLKLVINAGPKLNVSLKWRSDNSKPAVPVEQRYLLNSNKVFGLLATYKNNGKVIYKELEPAVDYRLYYFNRRPAFSYTTANGYQVEWDGQVLIKDPDVYEFMLHTFYDAVITINGKKAYEQAGGKEHFYPVRLAQGKAVVKISADYQYISNYWDPGSTLRFMYKKSGWREFGPVTYDVLSPGF